MYQTASYIHNQSGQPVTKLTMDEGVMTWNYTNVYADGQLFATYDAQGLHFDLDDWLGTRRVTTDYAGVVEQTCASLPYGDQLDCTGSVDAPNEQHFTGKTHDTESGLDYFGARYYSENDARFMSPDWASMPWAVPYAMLGNPQSLNLYSYVLNNPLSSLDPDGHAQVQVCGSTTWSTNSNGDTVVHGNCHDVHVDTNFAIRPPQDYPSWDMVPQPQPIERVIGPTPTPLLIDGVSPFDAEGLAEFEPEESRAIEQVLKDLAMSKPHVTNPKLQEIVDELFQTTDKVPGGTAGGVRYERMTGDLLSPKGHGQEAKEIINRLGKFLDNNRGISSHDQAVTKELIRDLRNAVNGK